MTSFATLSKFGGNSVVIWEFAGAVLTVFLTCAVIAAGVALVKRLINSV